MQGIQRHVYIGKGKAWEKVRGIGSITGQAGVQAGGKKGGEACRATEGMVLRDETRSQSRVTSFHVRQNQSPCLPFLSSPACHAALSNFPSEEHIYREYTPPPLRHRKEHRP